jgi:hypothetical protein
MDNSSRRVSPYQAIRTKCLNCSGDSYTEVKLCTVIDCPSWAWRFGFHPETAERKYPHLLNAPLVRHVVSRADTIVGSNSPTDIIGYLKQHHQAAIQSPPSSPAIALEAGSQEVIGVL